jgi:predicted transcriptional regulator
MRVRLREIIEADEIGALGGTMAHREARARGTLEAEVLACLAAADAPMTPGQVQGELDGDLAYTTVMTTLSRLYGKGAVERDLAGRAYAYSLIGGTDQARTNMTAHQMLRLLDDDKNRAGALTRFVSELGPDDAKLLADLLGEQIPDDLTRRMK